MHITFHYPIPLPSLAARLLATAVVAFSVGCQQPGLKEVKRPMELDPAVVSGFSPKKLSPGSESIVKEMKLDSMRRRDPAGAIRALEEAADNQSPLDPRHLAAAEILCNEAGTLKKGAPVTAIGWYLAAARIAYPAAIESQDSGERSKLLALYNHACGQVAELAHLANTQGGKPIASSSPFGGESVNFERRAADCFDPAIFDELKIAEYLKIKGYQEREFEPGIGGALVGHYARTEERAKADPFLPMCGLALPVTATLHFPAAAGALAELRLHDVLAKDDTLLGNNKFRLAADFTAPLALLSSISAMKSQGRKAMFRPEKFLASTGLYRLEPHRPGKIPVVLVHGLSKTPEVWAEMINRLRADPAIRDHYQFFCFRYPSGFPPAFCASALRQHLNQLREFADARGGSQAQRRMVLVGKSYGGVISSFQIRESGETLRELFATKPLDQLDLPDHQRQTLKAMLHFEPNPDIERVVFMVTPHLGTDVAEKDLAKLANKFIRYPFDLVTDGEIHTYDGITPLAREYVNRPPTSMESLLPHSPELETVKKMPLRPGITIHSIIGKVGDGPLEASNDKMVPYWSSHFEPAVSEIIVPSKHGNITHHPDAIQELHRILTLHLDEGNALGSADFVTGVPKG